MNKTKLHFYIRVDYDLMRYIGISNNIAMYIGFLNNMAMYGGKLDYIIDAEFHPGPTLGNPDKWVLHLYFKYRDFIKY
jgi:hypothetical protein